MRSCDCIISAHLKLKQLVVVTPKGVVFQIKNSKRCYELSLYRILFAKVGIKSCRGEICFLAFMAIKLYFKFLVAIYIIM